MEAQRWAMIRNQEVINVCLWDGNLKNWSPPPGVQMQLASDEIGIGWKLIGDQWQPPINVQETDGSMADKTCDPDE